MQKRPKAFRLLFRPEDSWELSPPAEEKPTKPQSGFATAAFRLTYGEVDRRIDALRTARQPHHRRRAAAARWHQLNHRRGLLPHSTLHPHAGGHVDLIANAAELGPVIEMFRNMHAYAVDIPPFPLHGPWREPLPRRIPDQLRPRRASAPEICYRAVVADTTACEVPVGDTAQGTCHRRAPCSRCARVESERYRGSTRV